MVWHWVVLPGTHNVTEVNSVLTLSPFGPESTTTGRTLVLMVGMDGPDGLLPPPQEIDTSVAIDSNPRTTHRAGVRITATPPEQSRQADSGAGRRDR